MKSIKLKKENGETIPCLIQMPEGAGEVIIMVHGFGSQKDCATAQMLFRRMPPAGFGVVTYDQPAHGPEEARDEPLLIRNCLSSLKTVETFVAKEYPEARIHYFSSSFGAYITVLYLCGFPHRGQKAFLRSAAVNLPELFLGTSGTGIDPEAKKELDEKGAVLSDLGPSAILIPAGFIEELKVNDLTDKFRTRIYDDADYEMVHGELDSTIELPYAREFADAFAIPITIIPEEEHTLSDHPETPDIVADLAIAFYRR